MIPCFNLYVFPAGDRFYRVGVLFRREHLLKTILRYIRTSWYEYLPKQQANHRIYGTLAA